MNRALVAGLGAALAASLAVAQDAAEPPPGEGEEVEEIIVVAPRPDDRRRVDREYEDPMRARLLKELYEMQVLEEEYEWRKSGAEVSPSRIEWGYDPRDDYRRREDMDIQKPNWETTEPATIFRFKF